MAPLFPMIDEKSYRSRSSWRVLAIRLERQRNSQRAYRLPSHEDRHADETFFLPRDIFAQRGAMGHRRFATHPRHDDGLPRVGHLSDDPLARLVANVMRRSAQPVGRLHLELVRLLVDDGDQAAECAVIARQRLEHLLEAGLQVQGGGERLADLQQRGELPDLVRWAGQNCRSDSASCQVILNERHPRVNGGERKVDIFVGSSHASDLFVRPRRRRAAAGAAADWRAGRRFRDRIALGSPSTRFATTAAIPNTSRPATPRQRAPSPNGGKP
jgi:hypothetical protein